MADFEKVIKGLECCRRGPIGCQQECLYKSDFGCRSQLAADALELLKEQEPRVLTLEELIAIGQIWTSNTPPYLFMDINPSIRRSCGFWCVWRDLSGMISGLHPKYTNDNYGIEWRCWTARPTDEQRGATPWDEPPKEGESE